MDKNKNYDDNDNDDEDYDDNEEEDEEDWEDDHDDVQVIRSLSRNTAKRLIITSSYSACLTLQPPSSLRTIYLSIPRLFSIGDGL